MRTKFIPALPVLGICLLVLALYVGYQKTYEAGQRHPRLFYWVHGNTTNAFGWDDDNQCVAAWTRSSDGFIWTKLRENPIHWEDSMFKVEQEGQTNYFADLKSAMASVKAGAVIRVPRGEYEQ